MTLEVKNASFGYPGKSDILQDVSFTLPAGRLLAVLGPNGVGKTTLLRCTLGLLPWRQGNTLYRDQDISAMSAAQKWQNFAYVPQARNAASLSLTGLDMVTIGRASRIGTFAQPGPKDREIARRTMREIGVRELEMVPCGQMSGGQLQMVLIARALAGDPEVLVLDEPETGLDFRNQLVVLDLLDELVHTRGLTVVMNTHYPAHALRIADHALLLSADSVPLYGPTAEVVTAETLSRVFRVSLEIVQARIEGARHQAILPIRALERPPR
ncbi:ABC transporter ATP-binding protein [Brevibacterium aurantiacum]|uniref:ABC transporter ATP-binding protein n=1 Tax=Brevibacterium aurantiacum TaxID=273384 RepID=A0A2H1J2K6_BREAU|nr:ABC transporter ATP-binding protein [Brevibacterium aurantiacum]MDN5585739.1 ABC transporter ATP-binding protein [Brevibacterium sp.]AZL07704.1 ABC transporter ATP-binding protein [Brevibacterium aurantiacum]PCC20351.1 ABC transporter ATP-binding protein [Brevibacterium aurantiacum]SMX81462.1 iron complex transport system ATP-binding protein [Brevibacterium aurantiacum]SMX98763.1 iron complex transport system ATP-binding protein [Brevibacterium aurantiacum]